MAGGHGFASNGGVTLSRGWPCHRWKPLDIPGTHLHLATQLLVLFPLITMVVSLITINVHGMRNSDKHASVVQWLLFLPSPVDFVFFCLSAEECARWFSSTKRLLLCCVPGFLALLRKYFALTPSFVSCPFVKWFTTVVFFRTSLSALPVSMRRLVTLLLTNSFLMLSVNPSVPAVLCRDFDTALISLWTVLVLNILSQFVSR